MGERWGWKVLVEEAGDALVVENWRTGWLSSTVSFGSAAVSEDFCPAGSAREEKLGSAESGERFGEREALVEEETDGEELDARVTEGCVEEVGAGRVEDEGRDVGLRGGEMGCEGGSGAGAVGDDLLRGQDGREVMRYCQAESASWVMLCWLGRVAALWP